MPEHLSFDERVNRIEAITGRRFNNKTLLQEALTMAGGPIQPPCRNNGQKSLALVGDAVLSLVLVMEGYQRGYEGGMISKVISVKASNANLAEVGMGNALDRLVYTNPAQHGVLSPRTMATAVEAILGAVYVDSGEDVQAVRSTMEALQLTWPNNEFLIEMFKCS
ncbi:hypothetical protein VTN31DRAFT_7423 [Thermomyces dupontii]|uniref:uncharacterized protein n=1 Tax=Talaromyces thermophilus TaxID=28565 RepID=UPI003743DDB0